jgi:hypothetical protein
MPLKDILATSLICLKYVNGTITSEGSVLPPSLLLIIGYRLELQTFIFILVGVIYMNVKNNIIL